MISTVASRQERVVVVVGTTLAGLAGFQQPSTMVNGVSSAAEKKRAQEDERGRRHRNPHSFVDDDDEDDDLDSDDGEDDEEADRRSGRMVLPIAVDRSHASGEDKDKDLATPIHLEGS